MISASVIIIQVHRMDNTLFDIASAFREAIKTAIATCKAREKSENGFPNGWCGYASGYLQKYLYDNGIETYYAGGTYGYGWEGESHTWLETEDGIVIDITGDQYKYKKLKFEIPVYVGKKENGFYDKFDQYIPTPYQESDDPKWNAEYQGIISCLV